MCFNESFLSFFFMKNSVFILFPKTIHVINNTLPYIVVYEGPHESVEICKNPKIVVVSF